MRRFAYMGVQMKGRTMRGVSAGQCNVWLRPRVQSEAQRRGPRHLRRPRAAVPTLSPLVTKASRIPQLRGSDKDDIAWSDEAGIFSLSFLLDNLETYPDCVDLLRSLDSRKLNPVHIVSTALTSYTGICPSIQSDGRA